VLAGRGDLDVDVARLDGDDGAAGNQAEQRVLGQVPAQRDPVPAAPGHGVIDPQLVGLQLPAPAVHGLTRQMAVTVVGSLDHHPVAGHTDRRPRHPGPAPRPERPPDLGGICPVHFERVMRGGRPFPVT
jgi:hypothetical protein